MAQVRQILFAGATEKYKDLQIAVLDSKNLCLWDMDNSEKPPKRFAFTKQEQFLTWGTFLAKHGCFVFSALDMTLKIFDRHLNMIQSISHGQRAMVSIHWNPTAEEL